MLPHVDNEKNMNSISHLKVLMTNKLLHQHSLGKNTSFIERAHSTGTNQVSICLKKLTEKYKERQSYYSLSFTDLLIP